MPQSRCIRSVVGAATSIGGSPHRPCKGVARLSACPGARPLRSDDVVAVEPHAAVSSRDEQPSTFIVA